MTSVLVKHGVYRNRPVENKTFTLVKGVQTGARGLYVTVQNDGHFEVNIPIVKIKVESVDDLVFSDAQAALPAGANVGSVPNAALAKNETDEQAMDRIASRFQILDEMTAATIAGTVRAVIVSGPPGVGKSYGVEQQLEKASLFDRIGDRKIRYEVVKGAITALGLYVQLYKFQEKKNVLVFDDCDSIFTDELSINIMKAALDSGKRRRICWNSDSSLLRKEGIPETFDFNGSAIFITNIKFASIRSKKLQDHLEALQSRCHYIDLTIDTERDKMLRIKQVHRDAKNGVFADYNLTAKQEEEIFQFMQDNSRRLREMSIRMALKIADLHRIAPKNWKNLAESTCMRRA